MMISNEKHRDVARKLRGVTEEELCYMFLGEILDCCTDGHCLDEEGAVGERLVLNRLADLIDRPSTTRHGKFRTKYGRKTPCCEVCGYSIGDMRWNYCPKCGAEVISDAS